MIATLLLASLYGMAQQGVIADSSGQVLYLFEDDKVLDAGGELKYTITGNMLFRGESQKKRDIILLVNSEDLFGRKLGRAFGSDMKTPAFMIYSGGFYLGGYPTSQQYLLGYYQLDETLGVLVFDKDSVLIATIQGEGLSNGQLTISFHLIMQQFALDESLKAELANIIVSSQGDFRESGTIKKLWTTGDEEFIWDGYSIKRRFNSFDYEEWKFDGSTLQRAWYSGGTEYSWDGQTLKQSFGNVNEEYTWDGRVMKSRWSQTGQAYTMQGNIVKPQWDSTGDEEWQIDGHVPVPIIMMVVFGLLRK